MNPNPLKSRCIVCKARPYFRHGGVDSDFTTCDCRGDHGGHTHVVYGGCELPRVWYLTPWYATRFYTVKFIRWVLAV